MARSKCTSITFIRSLKSTTEPCSRRWPYRTMIVRASLPEIKSQDLPRFSNDLRRARRGCRILRIQSIGKVGATGRVKRRAAAVVPHIFVGQFRDGDDLSLKFPLTSIANAATRACAARSFEVVRVAG